MDYSIRSNGKPSDSQLKHKQPSLKKWPPENPKRVQARSRLFILPAGLDILGVLSPSRLSHRADEARYLINTIVRKMVCRDLDYRGFARLHSDVLHKVLRRNTLAPMKRCMKAAGVIETASYSSGVRAIGYRLTPRYLEQRHVRVRPVDPILIKKLDREHTRLEAEQHKRQLPIHRKLASIQNCVTITPEANIIVNSLLPQARLCQDVLIDNLHSRNLSFSVSSTGRVFNCITGLKRELRTALRINEMPVASLDISCAQPALLGLLAQIPSPSNGVIWAETYKVGAWLVAGSLPSCCLPGCSLLGCGASVHCLSGGEVGLFSRLTCDESFYDRLAERCSMTRELVKRRFLVDVLAKRGSYPSAVENVFRSWFPFLWRFIKQINAKDHGTLIRLLQRLESWLVVETIAPRLVDRLPFVTLHDAVFCGRDDLPVVEAIFKEVFEEIGFAPSVKQEHWAS